MKGTWSPLLQIIADYDLNQRQYIIDLEKEVAALKKKISDDAHQAFMNAEQSSRNVLNAALAGITIGERKHATVQSTEAESTKETE